MPTVMNYRQSSLIINSCIANIKYSYHWNLLTVDDNSFMTADEDTDGSLGEITACDGSDMTDNQL